MTKAEMISRTIAEQQMSATLFRLANYCIERGEYETAAQCRFFAAEASTRARYLLINVLGTLERNREALEAWGVW